MSPTLSSSDLSEYLQANRIEGEILHLSAPTPTVEAAAAAVNAHVDQIVKTLIFLIQDEPVAAVACGTGPVDRRPIADRFAVGKKRVKMATPAQVREITGYEAGAVPPFGHLHPIRTLIDPRVLQQESVYAGGGDENALMRLSPQAILQQTHAEVLDLLNLPDTA